MTLLDMMSSESSDGDTSEKLFSASNSISRMASL
jgi:hypothetical protein